MRGFRRASSEAVLEKEAVFGLFFRYNFSSEAVAKAAAAAGMESRFTMRVSSDATFEIKKPPAAAAAAAFTPAPAPADTAQAPKQLSSLLPLTPDLARMVAAGVMTEAQARQTM